MRMPPSPRQFSTLIQWAEAMTRFVSGDPDQKSQPMPQPVLLARRNKSVTGDKAVTDGLVLFNEVTKKIEYSVGGQWLQLASEGSYGIAYGVEDIPASGEKNINYGLTFNSTPVILVATGRPLEDDTMFAASYDQATNDSVRLRLRAIEASFDKFVKPTSGPVSWLAIGDVS